MQNYKLLYIKINDYIFITNNNLLAVQAPDGCSQINSYVLHACYILLYFSLSKKSNENM